MTGARGILLAVRSRLCEKADELHIDIQLDFKQVFPHLFSQSLERAGQARCLRSIRASRLRSGRLSRFAEILRVTFRSEYESGGMAKN